MAPDSAEIMEFPRSQLIFASSFHFIASGHVTEFQAPPNNYTSAARARKSLIHFRSLVLQEQRSIKSSEVTQQESQNIAASSVRLQTDTFSSEKVLPLGRLFSLTLCLALGVGKSAPEYGASKISENQPCCRSIWRERQVYVYQHHRKNWRRPKKWTAATLFCTQIDCFIPRKEMAAALRS